MRDHDPYYGFSFCDKLVSMSEVSGIPNSLTCFVSFKKIIWLEAWDFDSLIPKRVLYVNLGTTRLRSRPRNRWQVEVREDGRIVVGEGWQEKVHNREEWKKLLRTARNFVFFKKSIWLEDWGFDSLIPRRVLYMTLGTTRLRSRPRNRWQVEVREDGRIVGGEAWQEKVQNREEWKKLLRTARNRHILHMPMWNE